MAASRSRLPPWPPAPGAAFFQDVADLMSDPTQGETGPRAHAPLKQKGLFEQQFAALCGRRFAIAVNSGTTALDLAVDALELPAGGVVIAADYGHPSTIRRAAERHRLRLVDIDPGTLCMSAGALAEALAAGEARLVMTTHTAGHSGNIDEIAALCRTHGVPLVVDASHAHGVSYRHGRAGSAGTMSVFSLHATKNLSCGEGGVVCVDDETLFCRIWRRHDIGRDPGAAPYDFVALGGNFRLSEIAALEARHRLANLAADVERRNASANHLIEALGQDGCLIPLTMDHGEQCGWHFFPAWYNSAAANGLARRRFLIAMAGAGVPCYGGWPRRLSELEFLREIVEPVATLTAARACSEVVWLDGRLLLASDGVERTLEALAAVQAKRSVGRP